MKLEPTDLHLNVKTQYFDEIKAGTKRLEYREVKPYWNKRLLCEDQTTPRVFRNVVIHNAYFTGAANVISFPWRGWEIIRGFQHPHFGYGQTNVYAITLEP